MKHQFVGILGLLVIALAVHHRVISINWRNLHKCKWQVIKWVACVIGGAIINYMMK